MRGLLDTAIQYIRGKPYLMESEKCCDILKIISLVEDYTTEQERDSIRRAFYFAKKAHEGQKRKSGDDYFIHPFEVARILAETKLDPSTIIAGFLHDVLEDTEVVADEIKKEFGQDVLNIVEGVTKISDINQKKKEDEDAENLIKLFLSAVEGDIRILLVKLADRLHNMRTLKYLPKEKRVKIAQETIDIFAPLAKRLGISRAERELEDLSFKYLHPTLYREIYLKIRDIIRTQSEFLNEVKKTLERELGKQHIKASIEGRIKNIYSIYNKMIKKQKEISEIYDIVALRVITKGDNREDCYRVLGIVHALWRPIPERFKDYIASPKPNLYRSLHTTVVGPHGNPLEIQIRTQGMHDVAEYGIAAHWLYKEGKDVKKVGLERVKQVTVLRRIFELLQEKKTPKEVLADIKEDILAEEVYVFTPKGDLISLPKGATPVDFAYRIHTDIGHTCVGAKVNKQMVPLSYKLRSGEIVEIITSKRSTPSKDWLKFVKSAHARNKIKAWFKKQSKEENVKIGREILEKEVKRYGLSVNNILSIANLKKACEAFSVNDVDTLLSMVKQGEISPTSLLEKIVPEDVEAFWREKRELGVKEWGKIVKVEDGRAIQVKGADDHNLLIKFAPCNPIPGDPIIGYITRGRGISIHRKDCPNILNLREEEKERLIEVKWASNFVQSYPVKLNIEAFDRVGLLSDVMSVFSDKGISATHVNTFIEDKIAYIEVTFTIENINRLRAIIKDIQKVDGIRKVFRAKSLHIDKLRREG